MKRLLKALRNKLNRKLTMKIRKNKAPKKTKSKKTLLKEKVVQEKSKLKKDKEKRMNSVTLWRLSLRKRRQLRSRKS